MPATADNLHDLHRPASACQGAARPPGFRPQDTGRPAGGPGRPHRPRSKHAKKALQDSKVQLKKHEHSLQSIETKIDDFKIKLNQVKKNEEYKALQNQIAHDNAAKSKIEEEILDAMRSSRPKQPSSQSSRTT